MFVKESKKNSIFFNIINISYLEERERERERERRERDGERQTDRQRWRERDPKRQMQ
jgi:hypothetical protein